MNRFDSNLFRLIMPTITLLFGIALAISLPSTVKAQSTYQVARRQPWSLIQDESDSQSTTSDTDDSADAAEPTAATPTPPQRRTSPRRRRSSKSPTNNGHFFTTNRFDFYNPGYPLDGYAEFLMPGRFSIADNNSAETDDRFIFQYQYFRNRLDSGITNCGCAVNRSFDVHQFTIGFEKQFGLYDDWSIEMRLPLYASEGVSFSEGFFSDNATTGNISLIAKHMLVNDGCRVVSAGLGMSVPTGDDTSLEAVNEVFTVNNDAVYLQPFLATLWTPNDCWFIHSFLHADVATNGNRIDYRQLVPAANDVALGSLTDQTLLQADCSVGYWWFRDRCGCGMTGLSTMLELHYVSTLNDANMVRGSTPGNTYRFGSASNRWDVLDLTLGCHLEVNQCTQLRAALVTPLRSGDDRFFDNEIQFSINSRF